MTMVSADDFVRIWQISSTVDEVVEATGLPKGTVVTRAANYRKKGVELKKFRTNIHQDWSRLNDIAKKYDSEEAKQEARLEEKKVKKPSPKNRKKKKEPEVIQNEDLQNMDLEDSEELYQE